MGPPWNFEDLMMSSPMELFHVFHGTSMYFQAPMGVRWDSYVTFMGLHWCFFEIYIRLLWFPWNLY